MNQILWRSSNGVRGYPGIRVEVERFSLFPGIPSILYPSELVAVSIREKIFDSLEKHNAPELLGLQSRLYTSLTSFSSTFFCAEVTCADTIRGNIYHNDCANTFVQHAALDTRVQLLQ